MLIHSKVSVCSNVDKNFQIYSNSASRPQIHLSKDNLPEKMHECFGQIVNKSPPSLPRPTTNHNFTTGKLPL